MTETTFGPFGAAKAVTQLARMLESGLISQQDYNVAAALATALKNPSMF